MSLADGFMERYLVATPQSAPFLVGELLKYTKELESMMSDKVLRFISLRKEIEDYRRTSKLSYTEIATKAGISGSVLTGAMYGTSIPSIRVQDQIKMYLDNNAKENK